MTLLAYTFYTATIKTYGHWEDFPPLLKLWKEMLNYKYAIEFKVAAYTKIKALIGKYT